MDFYFIFWQKIIFSSNRIAQRTVKSSVLSHCARAHPNFFLSLLIISYLATYGFSLWGCGSNKSGCLKVRYCDSNAVFYLYRGCEPTHELRKWVSKCKDLWNWPCVICAWGSPTGVRGEKKDLKLCNLRPTRREKHERRDWKIVHTHNLWRQYMAGGYMGKTDTLN